MNYFNMKQMKQWIFSILFLLISYSGTGQNTTHFDQATIAYNNGDYEKAIDGYMAILKSGEHSVSVYFNLANAHYKLSNIAESVYYYEKALQLAPNDSDVLNNLAFARQMTVDAIEPLPETGIGKIKNQVIQLFSLDGWAYLIILAMMLAIISFLGYYFSITVIWKRTFFSFSMSFLGISMLSMLPAVMLQSQRNSTIEAIVFDKEIHVKVEPNDRSEEAFILHEGTKVRILDSLQDWKKIELLDGKQGWTSASFLREL